MRGFLPTLALASLALLCLPQVVFAQAQGPIEGAGTVLDTTFGETKTIDELKSLMKKPTLQIRIPGAEFSDFDPSKDAYLGEDGSTYISIPYLAQYLAVIYKYGIALAAVLSVLMLIFSGVQWMLGAANEEMISSAQGKVKGALIGLLLAATSYTLLYTINPQLVEFRELRVLYIRNQGFVDYVGDLTQDIAANETLSLSQVGPTLTPAAGAVKSSIPLLKQWKPGTPPNGWADYPFGACGTIRSAGCGPTSLAMVLQKFGFTVTPPMVANEWVNLGYRLCSSSCDCGNKGQGGMFKDPTFLNKYGLKSTLLGKDKQKIIDALSQGKAVIGSVGGPSVFTGGSGHFIVLAGINANGTIVINDPNKSMYCNNGQTKCDKSLQTIPGSAVPQDILFTWLKGATVFEKK